MAKGGQKDHSGMNKETYDRHYAANKYIGGHHGIEGSPAQQVGTVDPLAQQQMVTQPAQQMTNIPPQQANTLGAAQPVFKPQAQQAAQGIYGGIEQRQNAVGASALFQRTSTPDNDEPTTYHDRLNFKGETQSQIINEADMSNSVERSEFVRDSIKGANKRIDKAIYNLKNPKMKMTQTFGKIKKI